MYSSKVYFTNIKPEMGTSQSLELEPLTKESSVNDYETLVFQSIVNEGKSGMVLSALSKRAQSYYDEKQLREAAAAEVAGQSLQEENGKLNRKRKGTDEIEKIQESRDRNREHAKNTRLRKKAYVIKLKELAEQLENQKVSEDTEKKIAATNLSQRDATRRNVVRLFLSYRESNIQEKSVWDAIVDENFVFTLPITPYRSFLKRDVISGSRVLVGVHALIADTSSLSLMVESVGQGSCQWKESMKRGVSCRVIYSVQQQDFHCAGDLVMCRYTMRTEGFQEVGAFSSCEQFGMLLCRFGDSNKLTSVEMVFDVMGFMQQLQRSTVITPETSVIPNTVDMAMQNSKEARAIVRSDPPFPVIHINSAWTELSGVPQEQAEAIPLSEVLRILPSQFEHFYDLIANCIEGQAGSAVLITQCPFTPEQPTLVYLKMYPLTSTSETTITHFLGIYTDLPLSVVEKKALLLHCKNAAAINADSTGNSIHMPVPLAEISNVFLPSFQQASPMQLPLIFNPESNRFIDKQQEASQSNCSSMSKSDNTDMVAGIKMNELPSNFKGVTYNGDSKIGDELASASASHYFNTNELCERVVSRFAGQKADNTSGCPDSTSSFDSGSGNLSGGDSMESPKVFHNNDGGRGAMHNNNNNASAAAMYVHHQQQQQQQHSNKRYKSDRTGINQPHHR